MTLRRGWAHNDVGFWTMGHVGGCGTIMVEGTTGTSRTGLAGLAIYVRWDIGAEGCHDFGWFFCLFVVFGDEDRGVGLGWRQ